MATVRLKSPSPGIADSGSCWRAYYCEAWRSSRRERRRPTPDVPARAAQLDLILPGIHDESLACLVIAGEGLGGVEAKQDTPPFAGLQKKHEIPNLCPRELWELSAAARAALRRMRRRPTLVRVDFRSGEIVWEQQIGTGSQFDSYVPGPMIGPGGALYVGVNGGFISMQDTR